MFLNNKRGWEEKNLIIVIIENKLFVLCFLLHLIWYTWYLFQNNNYKADEESSLVTGKDPEAQRLEYRADLMKELKGKGAPTFFSRIGYMLDMRKLAQWRLIIGVKRDGCIQLDQQAEVERSRFLEIKVLSI